MWRQARFCFAAVNALVIAYLVLFPKLNPVLPKLIDSVINSPAHLTLIAVSLVVLAVVVLKVSTGTGRPLSGGCPAGMRRLPLRLPLRLS